MERASRWVEDAMRRVFRPGGQYKVSIEPQSAAVKATETWFFQIRGLLFPFSPFFFSLIQVHIPRVLPSTLGYLLLGKLCMHSILASSDSGNCYRNMKASIESLTTPVKTGNCHPTRPLDKTSTTASSCRESQQPCLFSTPASPVR